MNKGVCTFFVNGQDFGLKVQFHTNLKKQKLELYPIISLTNHQHVIVNFGSQPWSYMPSTQSDYKPVSCSAVRKKIIEEKNQLHSNNSSEINEHDWDGPLCTLCFSEPKNTVLLPCKHDGFGRNCTNMLDIW